VDNPDTAGGVVIRMILEVLVFRSLLRNSTVVLREKGKLAFIPALGLWLAAMAFHWSMLLILLRHLRFFTDSSVVLGSVFIIEEADGFLLRQLWAPVLYVTSILFVLGLAYLLFRRLSSPQVRYISLVNDYFPLFLLLGIGISGLWLRHLSKTDVTSIKELAVGLATFHPVVADTIHPLFFAHFFLVCVLLGYFPFSKLTHMAGVFLSPTRNMANNNRMVRHVNPWDYPVKTHTYEEYEDEFREKMKASGVPVDKE
jgi:nitrate reductase gamma subunit